MTDAGIEARLVDFVGALRHHGLTVGTSETVDAGAVLAAVGLADREVLREGWAAALLHRADHRAVYDTLFDLWWPAALGERTTFERSDTAVDSLDAWRERLLAVLTDTDEGRDPWVAALVAHLVATHGRFRAAGGDRFSAYQSLRAAALDELEARLLAGLLAGDAGAAPTATARHVAEALAAARVGRVRDAVEAEVRRRSAEAQGRERVAAWGLPALPGDTDFLRASGEQLRTLARTVAPLARVLATRLAARRRAERGRIDLRRTLRRSMSTGGVPIDLATCAPRRSRPELVVLCDVSGSVAGFSHFTLLLVAALRRQFSRVRVFAFVDTTDEVTEHVGPGADLAEAVARILRSSQVHTLDGRSDYGHAFATFAARFPAALTPRTSLLVLGDARTNYRDPRIDLLTGMAAAARHAHWLNPEPQASWGTGDSAADRYRAVVPMYECRTAAQLAAVIAGLLPV